MKTIKTINELQSELGKHSKEHRSIGFVPTMGALHTGHISLVEQCAAENDITVVSIFVNPTQFNDKTDLMKYPRTLDSDCKLLEEAGADIVFVPDEREIYPEPDIRRFDFGALASVMEGRFRPGHFNGVAQVVSRLFEIVKPGRAYFGEKDFQQLAIIRKMVKQLNMDIEIVACPIVRESDGLAMSSRNVRLNTEQRKAAPEISKALFDSKEHYNIYTIEELRRSVIDRINASYQLEVEYFDIVDGYTLQPIQHWSDTTYPVGCIAVFAGNVRLIDNIVYENPRN